MAHIRRRRNRIRLFSFFAAGFVVAVGLAVTGFWMAYGLKQNIEYSYQRSLSDLSDHVGNIDVALQKAQYAGTLPQLVGIAGQIRMESEAAKTDLSQIAVANVNLNNTTKFLSQVGDYANSLSMAVTQNRKLTESDRQTISRLTGNADKLSTELTDLVSDVQEGHLTLFKSSGAVNTLSKNTALQANAVADGFQSMDNNLSGLPALIYDGPFSDNVLKKQPEMTKGQKAVSQAQAQSVAARLLGANASALKPNGDAAGTLPAYTFKTGTIVVAVSKSGGFPVRMLDGRSVPAAKLGTQAAVQKADAFLAAHGFADMQRTYTLTGNNVCVVNYAYALGQTVCYTDLMKVGVALDTGEIVSFDQTGFLMNHKKRSLPKAKISVAAARALLSPMLREQTQDLALIPVGGTQEALCYEFKCVSPSGQEVIDYINVATGFEEQILILKETPGGTLAM